MVIRRGVRDHFVCDDAKRHEVSKMRLRDVSTSFRNGYLRGWDERSYDVVGRDMDWDIFWVREWNGMDGWMDG